MRFRQVFNRSYRMLQGHFKSLPNGLYCFNYHRIGDSKKSDLDPNVYSCDATQFALHLDYYKQHYRVIDMAQLLDLINSDSVIDEPLALITFDDGYCDNYSQAFPLLKQRSLSASFFVSTDYIDESQLPWWDEIAWLLKNTQQKTVFLEGWQQAISIVGSNEEDLIRQVLREVKSNQTLGLQKQLQQLRTELVTQTIDAELYRELFMSWDQLREMQDAGMHIGSHSASHEILAYLDEKHQYHELYQSYKRIQQELQPTIASLAYPVGNAASFSPETERTAKQIGYQLAFSFISGLNSMLDETEKFRIRRIPVTHNSSVSKLKRFIFEAAHTKKRAIK
ncbi:polysaccharide deacetylase family protein [Alginatibacterium sediminis]|uniref:Polysaccharide deacetylase family protein n=1 Tax=Alginatibacterium sediminis TaxID=2164068 RepID=A0A420E888_9ALTE|nr:polysaccharide deacetylase family protein [Alginatibacterium sediminis]RKF14383.1 polysaccharide deacetylase family protein [Alginatibacterium sediminis]